MEHNFWKERWQQNEIGFHMDERHEYLHQFFHRLHVGPAAVFVPLCGKSPDLLWLRKQGARVVGVELSEIAVAAFFAENRLDIRQEKLKGFSLNHTEGLSIFRGDLFALTKDHLEDVRGVYDRGSLVALPPAMRKEYAAHLCKILPSDSRILLISYDYDQDELNGPPFSVPIHEIDNLFRSEFSLELLAQHDALPSHHILRQKGVSRLTEFVCLLTHV